MNRIVDIILNSKNAKMRIVRKYMAKKTIYIPLDFWFS
jgi:hypothetical protein